VTSGWELLLMLIVGGAGGFLAGLLGIGGGLIYVVVLSYYFNQFVLDDVEIVKYVVSNSIFAAFLPVSAELSARSGNDTITERK
jgi:uncharacterized membrane protein YfcA